MDHQLEKGLYLASGLIQDAGILLRLPQVVMTTAQILLQRVYHRPEYTIDKYPLDVTSMASLFLAAKIEENKRSVCQIIDVFTYVTSDKLRRDIVLSYTQYERVREELITAERRLLKTLGFNLLSSCPHKIIVNYYHAIVRKLDPENNVWKENDNKAVIQVAWNYCNDSLRLDVFLRFSKVAVACACIQLACESLGMLFPRASSGQEWYHLFVDDKYEVAEAMQRIRNLYDNPKPVDITNFKKNLFLLSLHASRHHMSSRSSRIAL